MMRVRASLPKVSYTTGLSFWVGGNDEAREKNTTRVGVQVHV